MKQESINERVFDLLTKTGLNWSVSKEQLTSKVDGTDAKDSYGIYKKLDRKYLSTVGARYEPLQNHTLAEAIILASDKLGVETTRGGSLLGGLKVYLQAELPDVYIGKSNVKRWLTGLNTHSSAMSTAFGSSNTVVVCENTFYRAYGELTKFRHTISAEQRIIQMAKDMNIALLKDQKLMDTFKEFAKMPVTESLVEKVIRKIFDVDAKATQVKEISTRKSNQLKAFNTALTTELDLEGPTVWGLFNGITRYTNHVIAPSAENQKLDFLMAGRGYEISNITLDILLKELNMEDALEVAETIAD